MINDYFELKYFNYTGGETHIRFPAGTVSEDMEKIVLFFEAITYHRSTIVSAMLEVANELDKKN